MLRPPLDFVAAVSYLIKGQTANFMAVGRAWRDFLRRHDRLPAQRRRIRRSRRAEATRTVYRFSIVVRYFFGRKRFGRLM